MLIWRGRSTPDAEGVRAGRGGFINLGVPKSCMRRRSAEMEEYLEAIYREKEKGKAATTVGLAKELRISPASVSQMLRKLAKGGLVELEPYKGAVLTRKGELIGKKVVGKHRLMEKFLALIGVEGNLHAEACMLEHAISDDVEKAIERVVKEKDVKRLSEMGRGECGKVVLIAAGASARKKLVEMGLTPGARVRVERASSAIGPVEICVRGSCLAIGRGLAGKVFVKKCE